MGLFKQGDNLRLKRNAEEALRDAIRELLLAIPTRTSRARIAIAKAAGILSGTVAGRVQLNKHRATKARTAGKGVDRAQAQAACGRPDKRQRRKRRLQRRVRKS